MGAIRFSSVALYCDQLPILGRQLLLNGGVRVEERWPQQPGDDKKNKKKSTHVRFHIFSESEVEDQGEEATNINERCLAVGNSAPCAC